MEGAAIGTVRGKEALAGALVDRGGLWGQRRASCHAIRPSSGVLHADCALRLHLLHLLHLSRSRWHHRPHAVRSCRCHGALVPLRRDKDGLRPAFDAAVPFAARRRRSRERQQRFRTWPGEAVSCRPSPSLTKTRQDTTQTPSAQRVGHIRAEAACCMLYFASGLLEGNSVLTAPGRNFGACPNQRVGGWRGGACRW